MGARSGAASARPAAIARRAFQPPKPLRSVHILVINRVVLSAASDDGFDRSLLGPPGHALTESRSGIAALGGEASISRGSCEVVAPHRPLGSRRLLWRRALLRQRRRTRGRGRPAACRT